MKLESFPKQVEMLCKAVCSYKQLEVLCYLGKSEQAQH